MKDPISDMLTRIRNSNLRKHKSVNIPFSSFKLNIIKVFQKEGFISSYEIEGGIPDKFIKVYLKFINKTPVIRGIGRVSKSGKRFYTPVDSLKKLYNGQGVYIVTTSRGVLSDRECRDFRVSGEVICYIY